MVPEIRTVAQTMKVRCSSWQYFPNCNNSLPSVSSIQGGVNNCDIFPTLQSPRARRAGWTLEGWAAGVMIMRWMSRNQLMIWRKTTSWKWMLDRTPLIALIKQKYAKVSAATNEKMFEYFEKYPSKFPRDQNLQVDCFMEPTVQIQMYIIHNEISNRQIYRHIVQHCRHSLSIQCYYSKVGCVLSFISSL